MWWMYCTLIKRPCLNKQINHVGIRQGANPFLCNYVVPSSSSNYSIAFRLYIRGAGVPMSPRLQILSIFQSIPTTSRLCSLVLPNVFGRCLTQHGPSQDLWQREAQLLINAYHIAPGLLHLRCSGTGGRDIDSVATGVHGRASPRRNNVEECFGIIEQ